MLTYLTVKNFKSFGPVQKARLAPITLIYGPNSAGKSSLIQEILLLKQSVDYRPIGDRGGPIDPSGSYHDFGSIRALVHGQRPDQNFQLGIGWDYPKSGAYSSMFEGLLPGLISELRATMNLKVSQVEQDDMPNRHWMRSVDYEFCGGTSVKPISFYQVRSRTTGLNGDNSSTPLGPTGRFRLKDLDSFMNLRQLIGCGSRQPEELEGRSTEFLEKMLFTGRASILPSLLEWDPSLFEGTLVFERDDSLPFLRNYRGLLGFEEFQQVVGHVLREVEDGYRAALERVLHLGPLRTPAPRGLVVNTGMGDRTPRSDGELTAVLFYEATLRKQQQINEWFKRLNLEYRVEVENYSNRNTGDALHLSLRARSNDPVTRSIADVGFGISQVLPIIFQGQINEDKTICVEQPEIHLHPRLQAEVADLFVGTYKQNRNQWVIETHSEQIIRRLKRRVKERIVSPEEISLLYVEPPSGATGGSRIKEIRLDHNGDFLDEWPRGFFEEGFNEMLEFSSIPSDDAAELVLDE